MSTTATQYTCSGCSTVEEAVKVPGKQSEWLPTGWGTVVIPVLGSPRIRNFLLCRDCLGKLNDRLIAHDGALMIDTKVEENVE